jgi:hypothetical protein
MTRDRMTCAVLLLAMGAWLAWAWAADNADPALWSTEPPSSVVATWSLADADTITIAPNSPLRFLEITAPDGSRVRCSLATLADLDRLAARVHRLERLHLALWEERRDLPLPWDETTEGKR